MNKIILIGNLTKDPEMKATPSGVTLCTFDIAVNDRRGGQDQTQYFRVTAWRKQGESCYQYLRKGNKVFVSGPLTARAYQANDGSSRVSLEVNADDVEFLTPTQEMARPVPNTPAPYNPPKQQRMDYNAGYTEVETDELPF